MNASSKICISVLSILMTLGMNACDSRPRPQTAQPVKPHSVYLQRPLDVNIQNVGAHFWGHNVQVLVEEAKEELRPKGEFETTAAYEQRKAQFAAQPLGEAPGSYFAFTDTFVGIPLDTTNNLKPSFDYNSDKQVFGLSFGTVGGGPVLLDSDGYGLSMDKTVRWSDFEMERLLIPMPLQQGQTFKPNAKVVLVCQLTEPYYERGSVAVYHNLGYDHEYVDHEVNLLHVRLVQMWVIDNSTGQVVTKISWPPKAVPEWAWRCATFGDCPHTSKKEAWSQLARATPKIR